MLQNAPESQEPLLSRFRQLQRRISSPIDRAAVFLDRHILILPVVLLSCFAVAVWTASLHKQLWHDELFTYLIAQAPDWRTLLHWTQTLDLNPPLSFALVRLSLHIFGTSAEAGRLPFMLGIVLCGTALFRTLLLLTRSSVWAAVGLVLLLEQYKQYAIEMRPYAMQAALLAVAVLAWQHVTREGDSRSAARLPALAVLTLSLTAGMLSHLFFLLLWAAFCFAEIVRSSTRRTFDPGATLALLLPLSVVGVYRPIFAMHAASYFPQKLQPKLLVLPWFYVDNARHILWLLLPGAIISLLLWSIRLGRATELSSMTHLISAPYLALLFALGAIPGLLILYLHLKHGAFFWRYGFIIGYVYALAFTLLAFWFWQGRRGPALLLLAGVFLLFGDFQPAVRALLHPVASFTHPPRPDCAVCHFAATNYPTLPLVDANGLTFVEMNERESATTLANVFFLVGRDEAIQYAHATIFEGMPAEHDAFGFRSPVEPYSAFIAGHSEFLVYGTKDSPEQWLLRKLQANGAQETLLCRVDASGYGDAEVWHVSTSPR